MRTQPPATCPIPWRSQYGPLPCGNPVRPGEHTCTSCRTDFAGRLRTGVADAVDALQVTMTKGDRFRRDIVRRALDDDHQPGDQPELGAHGTIPVNLDAAERARSLDDEITRWARLTHSRLWRGIPYALPAPPPTGTVPAAAWIADHLDQLAREPWLPTMVVRVDRRIRQALAACDAPDDRIRVKCPACGHDVPLSTDPDERIECSGWIPTTDGSRVYCEQWGLQRWWVQQCAPTDEPVRAGLLPLRLEAYGWHIKPEAVRQWIARRKLTPTGVDDKGRATYDVRHAVTIAQASAARTRVGRPA